MVIASTTLFNLYILYRGREDKTSQKGKGKNPLKGGSTLTISSIFSCFLSGENQENSQTELYSSGFSKTHKQWRKKRRHKGRFVPCCKKKKMLFFWGGGKGRREEELKWSRNMNWSFQEGKTRLGGKTNV